MHSHKEEHQPPKDLLGKIGGKLAAGAKVILGSHEIDDPKKTEKKDLGILLDELQFFTEDAIDIYLRSFLGLGKDDEPEKILGGISLRGLVEGLMQNDIPTFFDYGPASRLDKINDQYVHLEIDKKITVFFENMEDKIDNYKGQNNSVRDYTEADLKALKKNLSPLLINLLLIVYARTAYFKNNLATEHRTLLLKCAWSLIKIKKSTLTLWQHLVPALEQIVKQKNFADNIQKDILAAVEVIKIKIKEYQDKDSLLENKEEAKKEKKIHVAGVRIKKILDTDLTQVITTVPTEKAKQITEANEELLNNPNKTKKVWDYTLFGTKLKEAYKDYCAQRGVNKQHQKDWMEEQINALASIKTNDQAICFMELIKLLNKDQSGRLMPLVLKALEFFEVKEVPLFKMKM